MNTRFDIGFNGTSARLPLLVACAGILISMAGRGVASDATETDKNALDSGKSKSVGSTSPSVAVFKSSSTDSERGRPDAQSMAGRSPDEVETALGKPSGKLQNAQGALWLYSEWRVQFDQKGRVLTVEKDQPMRLSKLDPHFVASANAVTKSATARAAADDAARVNATLREGKVRVVSNDGQQVDLASHLAIGKITIVDFYADWCGPCRQISPQLEQMADANPDVALLKIDIVNWNTPVTRQFGIESVPNVRVFGRTGVQVGNATSDVNVVKKRVEQARKS